MGQAGRPAGAAASMPKCSSAWTTHTPAHPHTHLRPSTCSSDAATFPPLLPSAQHPGDTPPPLHAPPASERRRAHQEAASTEGQANSPAPRACACTGGMTSSLSGARTQGPILSALTQGFELREAAGVVDLSGTGRNPRGAQADTAWVRMRWLQLWRGRDGPGW